MMWFEYPGVLDRFMAKTRKDGECLIWVGNKAGGRKSLYGKFRLSRPVRREGYSHRLALEMKIGRELQAGEECLHSCDRHACVNPDHLRVGDRKANVRDAMARNRIPHGEGHKSSILCEQQVKEILALIAVPGTSHQDIADRYGVTKANIRAIAYGRTWKHVPRGA